MKNTPRRPTEEERELLLSCSFIEAKMIGESVKRKFQEYDIWAVDDSKGGTGLYIGSNLKDKVFYTIRGYAMAMLDQLRNISGGK